ncbi:MAG: DUF4282 domain-containing protein [Pirellulales bacterium]|nr:DUF4282 domain-containing protein [Pirellulales bacterium]
MGDRLADASSDRKPDATLDDFWAFRTMLAPVLIQVVFWVGALACVLYGVYLVARARSGDSWDQLQVLRGAGWAVFGPLAVRLACEVVILFFRINETLTEIKNRLK